MKAELKPYSGYRSAESNFLDCVPTDWDLRPLKTVLSKARGAIKAGPFGTQLLASEMADEGPVKVLNQRNVIDQNIEDGENFITEDKFSRLKAFEVFVGDILLTTRGTIGKTCMVKALREPAILHPCLIRIQADGRLVLIEYLMMLLSGSMTQEQLQILSNSTTIEVIYTETLKRVSLPIPSVDEQRDILAFLDRETAKIDRLMEVRRKQLERLQEQRAAVIHHAVTQGLDLNAKMKPSGVEWLGEVPEAWQVKRLKFIAACNQSVLGEDTPNDFVLDYIDIGNVTSTGDILEVQAFEFKDAPSRARRKLRKGSVIVSTVRTYLKAIAFIAEPSENLIVSTGFAVLDAKKELRAKFLYHALASEYFIQRVIAESKGVGYPAINASDLINIVVAYPRSLTEQDEVLRHIEQETTKFDALITKYRRELELLAEYRASLISHAVTGKIDVRGLVPPVTAESP